MNNDQTVQCQQEVNMSTSRYMHRECGVAISGATTVYRLVRWFTVDRLATMSFNYGAVAGASSALPPISLAARENNTAVMT